MAVMMKNTTAGTMTTSRSAHAPGQSKDVGASLCCGSEPLLAINPSASPNWLAAVGETIGLLLQKFQARGNFWVNREQRLAPTHYRPWEATIELL